MITTIYLIRHSVRFSSKLIDSYNTNQYKLKWKDYTKC